MPRVSREQAVKNRLVIEDAASRLFREHGFKGVSVAELMAAAGMTHGGFYGHFDSKDALVAVACGKAFEQSAQHWERRIADQPDQHTAFGAIVDFYLDPRRRDTPGSGCPAVSFASDVAREPRDAPVRASYVEGVKVMVEQMASLGDGGAAAGSSRALMQIAAMVGAVSLARATAGDPISDQFLLAVRGFLQRSA